MNNPELYRKVEICKSEIKLFLDEYKPMMRWRSDGKDSLLDIGCAGGNLTIELVHAMLPKTFSRLVGVDINETMVDYARRNYKIPKVSFDVLDIHGDVSEFLLKNERFDHITSFLCLHLVQNQKKVMENIFKLLQPRGDCLLYILVETPLYDIYKKLDKKWFEYMEDLDDFISPYYQRYNNEYLLTKYLKNAGFTEFGTKQRTEPLVYNDIEEFKDACRSVIPFFPRIPLAQKETFMEEFVDIAKEVTSINGQSEDQHNSGVHIIFPYKLLTVFAKKN